MANTKISAFTNQAALVGTEYLAAGVAGVNKKVLSTLFLWAAHKDASGGVPGLTLFKINFKNAAGTFTSFFQNSNTAARTYTFQDRNGTIADDTDLAGKQSTSAKDASGGYVGLTLFKINFKNAANTFTSFLQNTNTAARTYTFQDRDGTIADDTDLAGKQSTSAKDASNGYVGLTLFKINFKNAANTFTSFFQNTNTAARTYTFQDRDGVIADDTDLAAKATDTAVVHKATSETITGAKSFDDSTLLLKGLTSGTTTVKTDAIAGTSVVTIPATTDTLVGKATTDTLTNKRITPRVSTEVSNATPSINSDSIDHHIITALATTITSFTVTGTPTNGQKLRLSFTDDGTVRGITLGSNFEASDRPLPVNTGVASIRLDTEFVWNATTSKWRILSKSGRDEMRVDQNATTTTQVSINQDSGTAAATRMLMQNGTNNLFIEKLGTGYTTSGARNQAGSLVYNTGANPLALASDGNLELYAGGITSTERKMVITSVGVESTRVVPRVSSETSNTAPSVNIDNVDSHIITALAGNIATAITWTGTATSQQKLVLSITDDGTPRTLSWNSSKFESSGSVTLPTITVTSTRLDIEFIYNSATGKFRCINVA